jgi:hypothetical protein
VGFFYFVRFENLFISTNSRSYKMIKGLAITPPVIGRISIGKVVEKNGKRLPEKDDQFTITSLVQGKEGWILHPLDKAIRAAGEEKIRAIPIGERNATIHE